jgi:hypothetical protein
MRSYFSGAGLMSLSPMQPIDGPRAVAESATLRIVAVSVGASAIDRNKGESAVYLLRHRIHPALGKEAEVRADLIEHVKREQSKGRRVGLTQLLFSTEGPILVVGRWFDDLATLDQQRHAQLADAEWQEATLSLRLRSRDSIKTTLSESLIDPVPSGGTVGVVQRAFFYPALGKERQARAILEEFVRAAHASGRTQLSLWQQVFGVDGAVFTLLRTYADLSELDTVRKERRALVEALVTAIHEVSRAPAALRLFEVLVPPPPR